MCGSKFFMEGHEEIKKSISCEISKILLHKSKKGIILRRYLTKYVFKKETSYFVNYEKPLWQ